MDGATYEKSPGAWNRLACTPRLGMQTKLPMVHIFRGDTKKCRIKHMKTALYDCDESGLVYKMASNRTAAKGFFFGGKARKADSRTLLALKLTERRGCRLSLLPKSEKYLVSWKRRAWSWVCIRSKTTLHGSSQDFSMSSFPGLTRTLKSRKNKSFFCWQITAAHTGRQKRFRCFIAVSFLRLNTTKKRQLYMRG